MTWPVREDLPLRPITRGADSVYLFNWMDSETRPVALSDYQVLLRDGLSPPAVSQATRRYPVCYRDTVPARFSERHPVAGRRASGWQFPDPYRSASQSRPTCGPLSDLSSPDTAAATGWEASLNDHRLGPAETFTRSPGTGRPCGLCDSFRLSAGHSRRKATTSSASDAAREPRLNRSCGSNCAWFRSMPPPSQPAPFPGQVSDWNGFQRYDFEVDGKPVLVVAPRQPAPGRPWVWHGEFFGHKPAPDIALLGTRFSRRLHERARYVGLPCKPCGTGMRFTVN